jgi:choline-glycine betaine transporter
MAALMALCKYEEPSESEKGHMQKCWNLEIPGILVCNPVVFLSSVFFLWTFVIISCVEPDYVREGMRFVAFDWITEVWTWLYIFSQDYWVVVLMYAAIYYGDLKLGNVKPDFSTATWFSMLFCCGVATGFFWYAVAEPVWHYKGSRNWNSLGGGGGNRDEDAMISMVYTIYHWGVHGWIPYTTMGAVLAIMTYRRGYPMTVRYCFTPLIGDMVYGWMGDFVDALSIITSIAGVCTSLGIGAMQINGGLQRLNHGFYRGVNYAIPNEPRYADPTCNGHGQFCDKVGDVQLEAYGIQRNVSTQILIVLIITCMATISVALGLGRGIKLVSQFVFACGCFLSLMVLLQGETYAQLDTMVQVTGHYIWYVMKLGFHTDVWERMGNKEMGLGGDETGTMGGSGFMAGWTLFYWGWWISWGPFVGTFIAKISRGRTLREFILATLFVPTIYCIFWFSVWGVEGIRLQRMADGSGLCSTSATPAKCGEFGAAGTCKNYAGAFTTDELKAAKIGWNPSCVLDPAHHDGFGKCQVSSFTHWAVLGDECIETTTWVTVPCKAADGTAGADPTAMSLSAFSDSGSMKFCKDKITTEAELNDMYNKFKAADQPECFKPLQEGVACISGQSGGDMMYDLLSSYGPRGFSDLLCAIALCTLALYFVTSSDSGSLVVDILSANGHPEPPLFQRVFWSFTEGATAIALLYSGVNSPSANASLKALQNASLITGLPYTFVIFWCCQALVILCAEETYKETDGAKGLDPNRKAFTTFILNIAGMKNHLVNFVAPGIAVGKTIAICGKWPFDSLGPGAVRGIWTTFFSMLYYCGIIVPWLGFITPNWMYVGLTLYIGFGVLLGLVRNGVRLRYDIGHGDLITDVLCGIFVPMFTISQFEVQMKEPVPDPAAVKEGASSNVETI